MTKSKPGPAKNDRTGEVNVSKQGFTMEVIEYINNADITVRIRENGEIKKCEYKAFKNGTLKSNFFPSVMGVGYIGNAKTMIDSKTFKKSYHYWCDMLYRCYDPKGLEKNPAYKECKVCNEWLCFENYEKWFNSNYYEMDGCRVEVDKDILVKRNKIYSPDNCIFVPSIINALLISRKSDRGALPIGVCFHKATGKYNAQINIEGKRKSLGFYKTPEEAFEVYKVEKEKYIKEIADKYKNQIPEKLYNALYSYNVEIDD